MFKRGRVVISLVFIVALTFAATTAHADLWSRLYQYYSDSTFTIQIGEVFVVGTHCPDDQGYSWGTTCDYRKLTIIQECGTTSGDGSICSHYVNGQWQTINCP
jgi:hypothetical protein